MKHEARIGQQLRALGDHVLAERDAIMNAWRQAVKNDPELKTARTLSRSRFDDYIPALLRAFSHHLGAWPGSGIIAAEAEQEQRGLEHGAHRWREGFALSEVAREWLHLHLALLDFFEHDAAHRRLDGETMVIARRLLALLCAEGVNRSVSEYTRLMQVEAAGRVRDLEAVVEELNGLQRERAHAWREAEHDLRNTIGLVSNASGILRRTDAPDPVRAKSLQALQSGVSFLSTMLSDLLTLARLEAGLEKRAVASFDAGAVLGALCVQMRASAAARGLSLHTGGPDSFVVEGDQEKVERIACGLLSNALTRTPRGGVAMSWTADEDGDPRRWVLIVENTAGRGHSDAAAPAIGEMRQIDERENADEASGRAADAPRSGVGTSSGRGHGEAIGLSIVEHLCELLDATLEISANAGGGSTLRVVFPCRYQGG
jgi:signal transduction histidine kinase